MYFPKTFYKANIAPTPKTENDKKNTFLQGWLLFFMLHIFSLSLAQLPTNGGGGGTFVVQKKDQTPLIIAGGGGGASGQCCSVSVQNGNPGVIANTGTASTFGCASIAEPGTDGKGGSSYTGNFGSGSGGGFFSDGGNATGEGYVGTGGASYLHGGSGGNGWIAYQNKNVSAMGQTRGGFGGGGGAGHNGLATNTNGSGGGGGGYSGGGGGGASCNWSSGGGGGSYNTGTNQKNYDGSDSIFGNTGDGSVLISWIGGSQVFRKKPHSLQLFIVPAGVSSLSIIAKGAQGGSVKEINDPGGYICHNTGGKGAYMSGTFSVSAGETFEILVGEMPVSFDELPPVNCPVNMNANVSAKGGGTFFQTAVIYASSTSKGTIFFQGTNRNGTSTEDADTSKTIVSSGNYYFRCRANTGCWGTPDSVSVTIVTKPIVSPVYNLRPARLLNEQAMVFGEQLNVTVMPNPSTTYFTLKLESKLATLFSIKIVDASGRLIDARTNVSSNTPFQIGHNYSVGTYYAEIIQGNQRRVVTLLKTGK